MDLPHFNAVTPAVVPAADEKVYDKYWMRVFTADARSLDCVRIHAEFQPYRYILDDSGNVIGSELKIPEVDGDIIVITLDNIFLLLQDPTYMPEITIEIREILGQALYAMTTGMLVWGQALVKFKREENVNSSTSNNMIPRDIQQQLKF